MSEIIGIDIKRSLNPLFIWLGPNLSMHENWPHCWNVSNFALRKFWFAHILSMNLSNMDFEWETTFQWMFILKWKHKHLFKPGSNIKREITRPSFSPQFKIYGAFELELWLDFINEIWNCYSFIACFFFFIKCHYPQVWRMRVVN